MEWSIVFVANSVLLGVGLAMDAFSVSMANGLHEPRMKAGRMCEIAGTFGGFQIAMPLIGWVCVHTVVQYFQVFSAFIPWIALFLLAWIGGKMLWEGIRNEEQEEGSAAVGFAALMLQGIATSIDALSVGFAIADYGVLMAVVCSVIVGVVTFFLCIGGLFIGKNFGTRLSNKASILGGVILIAIGLEIFIRGVLG
ncbi:MAG: manganese efflux pump MntP family protein [Eubacteriales bacterium]|nr:manganese efflux pump MntP family protein [Eubacteriales bacterium]